MKEGLFERFFYSEPDDPAETFNLTSFIYEKN